MNLLYLKEDYEKRLEAESAPTEDDFINAAHTIIKLCEYIRIHHGFGEPYEELKESRGLIEKFLLEFDGLDNGLIKKAKGFVGRMQFKDKLIALIKI